MMHTESVIYRKPNDKQKYITFAQFPGETPNEYFTKQVCMNYGVEFVSCQLEENPTRRLSKAEKDRLKVVRKPYEFFAGHWKELI